MYLITKSPIASSTADGKCLCISVMILPLYFTLQTGVCFDCAVFCILAVSQYENAIFLIWIMFCNMWIVAMRTECNIYHLCAISHNMSCSRKK